MHSPITLGSCLKKVDFGKLILTETKHPPSLHLPAHSHELPNLVVILSGSVKEVLEHRAYDCKRASIMVKPGGEIHSDVYGLAGARSLIIEMKNGWLDERDLSTRLFRDAQHVQDEILWGLAARIHSEFLLQDEDSALSIEGLLLELLANLHRKDSSRQEARMPNWLKHAREILEQQFSEDIGLLKLSKQVGTNPSHLARMFRKHYGSTIGEHLRRRRISYAQDRLIESHESILEIALAAGFYDQSHFTHAFKRETGMTPAQFRASFRFTSVRRV